MGNGGMSGSAERCIVANNPAAPPKNEGDTGRADRKARTDDDLLQE